MSKLERLLNLTAALLETERPLPATEIRRRIEGYPDNDASFRRAFERDKDDLREMGVPISIEAVPGSDPPVDGYRIRKSDYYLPDPGLDADELAAIHLAADVVRLDGLAGAEAIRKLGGRVGGGGDDTVVQVRTDPRLVRLFEAIASRSEVGFSYRGEQRRLQPWRLDYVRGRWYLTGHDLARDDERNFRLDRIEGDVEVGAPDSFDRHTPAGGVRRQPWQLGDDPPRTARVLVDADQAAWAIQHVGAPVETRDDGSVVVELVVTNDEAFRSFVLTFLDHAEVLEPVDLRDDMIAWLTTMAGAPGERTS